MRATVLSILMSSILSLVLAASAGAEPYWAQLSVTVAAPDAAKVVAAANALMSSEVGKTFPGRMLLQANVADGSNPATHTFVPMYKSAADREAFVQALQGSDAWAKFQATMAGLGDPGGNTVLYRNLRHWGEVNDTDGVWMTHAFDVSDPAALVAALDAFRKSPTGQKSPGQIYLSAVVAGGMSPVSHVISVGYASVAEMADWLVVRDASADWATFQQAMSTAAEYVGGSMSSNVATYGTATMEQIVGP